MHLLVITTVVSVKKSRDELCTALEKETTADNVYASKSLLHLERTIDSIRGASMRVANERLTR